MLQQTQVERVIPFYEHFIRKFPTVQTLARAPLADVLRAWQGLGYNRRAKMLREAAQTIVRKYKGKFPTAYRELVELPGVGPYTARAVAAFAYGADGVFVETNIRTAVIHHFFPRRSDVEDSELVEILTAVLPKGRAREWYSALMDYGAELKRSGVRVNGKSRHYVKQARFTGSMREARGAILRELSKGPQTDTRLSGLLGKERRAQLRAALAALAGEGLVRRTRTHYALAS